MTNSTTAAYNIRMLIRLAFIIGLLLTAACGPRSNDAERKPAGTIGDPVEVCEKLAQVCRIDKSRLGVCTTTSGGRLMCASQH